MMNAAFVFDERNCNKREDYDEHNALFVLREFENPEEAFHVILAQLWYLSRPAICFASLLILQSCHSERSEESQIIFLRALPKH
jgi:hypothetical protein